MDEIRAVVWHPNNNTIAIISNGRCWAYVSGPVNAPCGHE